jgi:PAS domain S-box-containing protein
MPIAAKTSLLIQRAVTFAAIFTTGFVGLALPTWGARFPLPLLQGGIAAAATYRWGRRMGLPVFIAGVTFQLATKQSLIASVGVGAGLAVGGLVSAWLLEKNGFEPNFGRARDVLIFLFAVVVGMSITPTIGVAGFLLAGAPSATPQYLRWIRWWSNTMVGVLLVSPALIAISRQSLTRFYEHWIEGVLWILCVASCCAVIALSPTPGRSAIVMFSIMLVVVSAIRFGLVVSTLGALSISTMTAVSFSFGFGMFGELTEFPGRLTLFSFTAMLIAASLLITALLAERDAAALEKLRAEHRYAQIFNGSPQAIWVHDPHDLRFLLVNEAAQRQYGWTLDELLTRNVAVLAPATELNILPSGPTSDGAVRDYAGPFETRHVTRDGRILEVEVWMRSIDLGGRPAELVFAVDVSERRTFGNALVDAQAGEQRRIAREIHDGLGQELTGLALSLRALATRAERSLPPSAADLDGLAKLATRCIEGAKRIVQGLSPLNDAGGSLEAALGALARRASLSGTLVRFRATGEVPLAASTDTLDHFYRIAQEAVQNALTHAAARAIDLELRSDTGGIELSIVDDGAGLPVDIASRAGLGMRTMHFRARAIGGRLTIETLGKHGGVAVRCEVAQAPSHG